MDTKEIYQSVASRLVVNREEDEIVILQNTADRVQIDRIVIDRESIPDLIDILNEMYYQR